ncbi:MAG: methylated-DNA-protein-cysteine methyltransferase [Parcubacteria group bacterium GW2011_GWA1_42_7]|nr:MAG: methylated-DNA-protein-cysteine methyltransferase [Parcubacteria group bacterium GW2011_GWB1_42_6]KKS69163.1 MAG: methylated-DNA-protein-cysteine methyltransferase [Parcubacteria group bacterium GW2011_GWA1_42_7]KKS91952.1 MAG: methylated-DNA-protein-cysteine methyltransferase [Parcubacteria group bacterium GW2011_GWC1_43_12]
MTEFQKAVYKIASQIPKGKVLTYKQVAALAGRPRAYRAAGNILNKNRDPKVFCHRVIRSDGKVGGFNRGSAEKIKKLKKEGVVLKNGKICHCEERVFERRSNPVI